MLPLQSAADSRYGYAAPKQEDASTSITFSARSKRGVGHATLEFSMKKTRACLTEGGLDDFHGTGKICNHMGGIGGYGDGTYTVSADENGSTLTVTGNGWVKSPMGTHCANDSER